MGTNQKCLTEVLLISTHNIGFHGEIRKISVFLDRKSVSSRAMGMNGKYLSVIFFIADLSLLKIGCFSQPKYLDIQRNC